MFSRIDQLDNNRVNVVFVINEGGRTKIADIDFIGNNAFSGSAGEIRAVLTGNGLNTRVLIDADGDGVADFELMLLGVTAFSDANLDNPA